MQGVNPVKSDCKKFWFSAKEEEIIDKEIEKLLKMKVIIEVKHHTNEYISPIFVIPKRNGEFRMILHLKELNNLLFIIILRWKLLNLFLN
jgi:hypothetical protein